MVEGEDWFHWHHYIWIQIGALLHQRPNGEPETVGDGELVLLHVVFGVTGMRIVPLVRGETGYDIDGDRHQTIGCEHIQPNFDS